jgi:hypothetical protein
LPTDEEKRMLGELEDFRGDLATRNSGLAVRPDVAAAERYKALVSFAVDNFEFGVHYDIAPGEYVPDNLTRDEIIKDKKIRKCMNQPGAEMLNAAWRLHPEYSIVEKVETEALFSYTIECQLKDIHGAVHGSAIGTASTNETKYKYRWLTGKQIAADPRIRKVVDMDSCKTRGSGAYLKYQVPNLELGDLSPTLIMMATKRAFVKATRTTFAISALFQQPLEDVKAALEMKEEREAETEERPTRPEPKDRTLPRAVATLKALFEERCGQHKMKGNAEKTIREKMFGVAGIVGWKDVLSEEIENRIQAFIDEMLPEVEGSSEHQETLL